MNIERFRKKPVVINTVLLTVNNTREVAEWCGGSVYSKPPMRAVTGVLIPTLEGDHVADFGDRVLEGVKGEFYPCKPDIFEMTYEVCDV